MKMLLLGILFLTQMAQAHMILNVENSGRGSILISLQQDKEFDSMLIDALVKSTKMKTPDFFVDGNDWRLASETIPGELTKVYLSKTMSGGYVDVLLKSENFPSISTVIGTNSLKMEDGTLTRRLFDVLRASTSSHVVKGGNGDITSSVWIELGDESINCGRVESDGSTACEITRKLE